MPDAEARTASLPEVTADLLLVHPPAVFDFRERRDIYFPYLSTSGDVPITPLYEYFPVGFKTLRRFLLEAGFDARIVNLSSVLLRYPTVDVRALIGAMRPRLFGIDLHWMVHVQGSLAVAELLKEIHPETPVVFGGISSTFYAEELIRYPFVDMVLRGYDTHAPMEGLLGALRDGRRLGSVQNLLWKDGVGEPVDNGFDYRPDTYGCAIDWSDLPPMPEKKGFPILEVLSTQNVGCAYNCTWCGGSREAFRRVFGKAGALAKKPVAEMEREFATMAGIPDLEQYHFYSVGAYNEPKDRLEAFVDFVAGSDFRSISYEQYHLTPPDVLRKMARANPRTFITLSPESHDPHVAKLAGRGVYTMEEMEEWIEKALAAGIHEVDCWFFIGMPEQDEASVEGTVEYCGRLLERFRGERVVPLICPMIPFLDPASTLFEEPEKYGYRVFHRTVEEHRRGMERASLINRINYETKWLSRRDLVHVGYRAVRTLTGMKRDVGMIPRSIAERVRERIDDALAFIDVVHEADCLEDPAERRAALDDLGDEILARNREIFFKGVANQAFPLEREIGGRWFDEMLWDPEVLEAWIGRS